MSILPHTVAGAVAGSFFDNPILAGLAGGVSHLVLDAIPHFDPPISKRKAMPRFIKTLVTLVILVDLLLGLFVLWLLKGHANLVVGGIIGPAVDLDNFLQYRFLKGPFPLISKIGIKIHDEGSNWHHKLQFKSFLVNLILGVILQLAVTLAGLFYLNYKFNLHLETLMLKFL